MREPPKAPSRMELAKIENPTRPDLAGIVQDTLVRFYPPALSRNRRAWYATDLGVLTAPKLTLGGVEAAGHDVAVFAIRMGGPLLGRLRSRSLGLGLYDDLAVLGQYGYQFDGVGPKERTWGGGVSYTATVGYRAPVLALLVGARANAYALKLSGSKGSTTTVPLFAQFAFAAYKVGFAFEAWASPVYGDDSRGAAVYLVQPGTGGRGGQGFTSGIIALRAEENQLDACAAVEGMGCMDVPSLRVRSYSLVLGVGFQ